MNTNRERRLVYTALMAVCLAAAALAGWQAAIWTLVQMGLVMEGVYWLARPIRHQSEFDTDYRV